jgi:uncharacterized protein (DUF1501 family)
MCTTGSMLRDGPAHAGAHVGWSRRQFLRGVALAGGSVALGLGGVPVHAGTDARLLAALQASDPERILVLIQLAGGNDGLNTVIPVTNDLYYQARPRLGIRAQNTVALNGEMALHSGLRAWEAPYKDGRLAIIQNVGYDNPELSHFVSTDVWLTGDNAQDLSGTGWLGRYLDGTTPDFDASLPEHPVAVQIGSTSPLLLQAAERSLGVNFPSPSLLNRLIQGSGVYDAEGVPDTLLGEELSFVRRVSNSSFTYAQVLKSAYDSGSNRVGYPGSSLGQNLATIARLIRGGLASRIYHVTIGGFDTHADQAGGHSNLLRQLGDATAAFVNDLGVDGLSERVLAMTFSEFGRRIHENSSVGTDHGTAAPLFVFGPGLTGGLIGQNPDLAGLDANGNLVAGADFRSVYAAVLEGWFGLTAPAVSSLLGGSYTAVPLFQTQTGLGSSASSLPGSTVIDGLFPNPARDTATIQLSLSQTLPVQASLVDLLGRQVASLFNVVLPAGRQTIGFHIPARIAAGHYLVRVRSGASLLSRPLVVID